MRIATFLPRSNLLLAWDDSGDIEPFTAHPADNRLGYLIITKEAKAKALTKEYNFKLLQVGVWVHKVVEATGLALLGKNPDPSLWEKRLKELIRR